MLLHFADGHMSHNNISCSRLCLPKSSSPFSGLQVLDSFGDGIGCESMLAPCKLWVRASAPCACGTLSPNFCSSQSEPKWICGARESLERFDIDCHGEGKALQLGAHQEEAKVTCNLSA